VSLSSGKTFTHNPKADYTTFAFVFEGTAYIDKAAIKAQNCILFSPNMKTIKVEAKEGARFLFVSGNRRGHIHKNAKIINNPNNSLRQFSKRKKNLHV
jgi:redox-sensitive bicupin YhaK (pirin superfamily)